MARNLFLLFGFVFFIAGGVFFYKGHAQSTEHQATPAAAAPTTSSSVNVPSQVREPASAPGMKELNDIVFSIKKKEDVDPALKAIRDFAAKNPDNRQAQVYSILATPVPLFKGMFWRLRMIVEPVDVGYIGVITRLRTFKRNNDRRATHLDALFEYLVSPNPGEDIQGQKDLFTSMGQFQDYMAQKVGPVLAEQARQLRAIAEAAPANEPLFYYDAALMFGAEDGAMMSSQTMRYRKFMPANLWAMTANVELRLAVGQYLASYNMEKLGDFLNSLTSKALLAKHSSFAHGIIANVFDIHLQSPKEVGAELRNPHYADLLTLRDAAKGPKGYLAKSLAAFRQATADRIKAYAGMEQIAQLPNQNEYFIDPDWLTSRNLVTMPILQKRQRLIDATQAVTFNDRVTNSEFPVFIAAIFDSNNAGIQDLKRLYPTQFLNVPEKVGNNPKTFAWNYDYGKATGWADPTFAGLLPGTSSGEQFNDKLVSLSRDGSTGMLQEWLRLFF